MLFGLSLGVAGFGWLWGAVNLLAAALSTAGLVFYVVVYTMYLKRSTPQNIVIGGAAGAVPALVGWAAVTGTLEIGAWVLFAIVFVWTPPHFWALAIRYRTDYEAAGIPMLPVVIGIEDTLDHIGWYTLLLGGITLLLYPATQLGAIYLVPAVALTVALSLAAFRLKRSPDRTMVFFGWTNLFLAAISAAAIADRLATVEVGGHLAVLYLSVAIIAVAGAIVLVRELASQRRRHVRRRLEDVLYVVAPFAGLAALVLAVL